MNKISFAVSFLLLAVCTSLAQKIRKSTQYRIVLLFFQKSVWLRIVQAGLSGLFLLMELQILFR